MTPAPLDADELIDPTQMHSVTVMQDKAGRSSLARIERYLGITARSLTAITSQNREQMHRFAALGRTMQLIAFATSVGALALLLYLIFLVRDIVALVAISFLIAYMMDPLVRFFERRGARRMLVVALFSLLLLGLALLGALYLVEGLVAQVKGLLEDLPTFGQQLRTRLYDWEAAIKIRIPSLAQVDLVEQAETALRKYGVLERIVPTAASVGSNIVPLLSGLAIIPLLTFFMLNNGSKIRKGLVESVPNPYFEPTLVLLDELDRQLGQYIRSRVVETAVLSILATIGLQILGIHFAIILGLLLGIANLIPYFGPVLGTLPPALVALGGSHIGDWGIVGVILLSFGLQFIDNAVLFPLVVGKSVDLGPIATILVVLIGSEFFGLAGLLLAVPVAAMLKAAIQIIYREASGYWRY